MPFTGGVGLKLPAAASHNDSASVSLNLGSTLPPAPPAPMLECDLDFTGGGSNRGMELILGPGPRDLDRWITVFLRRLAINPAYFLLMPGGRIDWGVIVGKPSGRTPADPYCEFVMGDFSLITFSPLVGLMLNPLAIVPPFLTASPPFWLVVPILMGDFFTDETAARGLEFRARLPGLLECALVFKRPLPRLTLAMMLELAAVAIQKFQVEIPAASSLRTLFYGELSGSLTLPLLAEFFADDSGTLAAGLSFNIVEMANSFLRLSDQVQGAVRESARAVERGRQLFSDLTADPAWMVRMIPRAQRLLSFNTRLTLQTGLHFDCRLDACLLLPEELEEELDLFLDNRRPRGKGLGAIREPVPGGDSITRLTRPATELIREVVRQKDPLASISAASFTALKKKAERKVQSAMLAAVRQGIREIQATRPAVKNFEVTVTPVQPSPDALADRLVQAALAPGQAIPGALRLLRKAVGASPEARAALSARVETALRRLKGITALPAAQAAALRTSVTRQIAASLRSGVQPLVVKGVRQENLPAALATASQALFKGAAAPAPESVTVKATRVTSDLRRFGQRWREMRERHRLSEWTGLPGKATPATTHEPRGYFIRLRSAFRAQAPDFKIQVPTRNTPFRVRFRAGSYVVEAGAGARAVRIVLPPEIVNTVAFGPRRAAVLHSRLELVEMHQSRSLSAAERAYQASSDIESNPNLYKTSIFYSDVFKVKADGGRRGATYLPDLLRHPQGGITIPGQPGLAAGVKLNLLAGRTASLEVQFAGLLSPPRLLLLYGYLDHRLSFGRFSAEVQGDALLRADETGGAVTLNGYAVIKKGSSRLFEGEASGQVEMSGGRRTLKVEVASQVDWTAELEFEEARLLKVHLSGTLRTSVSLAQDLKATAEARLDFSYRTGQFKTEQRQVSLDVCSLAGGACPVAVVTYEEPQLDEEMEWSAPINTTATVRASVNSSTGEVTFTVHHAILPGGSMSLGSHLPG
jgi:hypothetical protein